MPRIRHGTDFRKMHIWFYSVQWGSR